METTLLAGDVADLLGITENELNSVRKIKFFVNPTTGVANRLRVYVFAGDKSIPNNITLTAGETPAVDPELHGSISGIVTGTLDAPIEGAVVTIGEVDDITNASGEYTINGLAAGDYDLVVTATGYVTGGASDVTVVAGEDTSDTDIALVAV